MPWGQNSAVQWILFWFLRELVLSFLEISFQKENISCAKTATHFFSKQYFLQGDFLFYLSARPAFPLFFVLKDYRDWAMFYPSWIKPLLVVQLSVLCRLITNQPTTNPSKVTLWEPFLLISHVAEFRFESGQNYHYL